MNGRKAKQLRREGLRPRKVVQHIEADDGTDYRFNKELYRERRKRGLRGTIQPPPYYQPVYDEEGKLIGRMPMGGKEIKGV